MSHVAAGAGRELYGETETIVRVIRDLQAVRRDVTGVHRDRLDRSILLLQELAEQAQAGLHKNPRGRRVRNPSLVIFNPVVAHAHRGGPHLIGDAIEIKYDWRGKGYVHEFDSHPTVLGVTERDGDRTIKIVGTKPLWATPAEVDSGRIEL